MNNIATIIESSKTSFIDKADKMQTGLEYSVEASFAAQSISKNKHVYDVALKNPKSLKNAMTNLGAIGLSLNPAEAYAYLVPRDGAICLDIGYRGLVKLATDCGFIKWCQAEIVYANDTFEFMGVGEKPTHKANPFGERGNMIGVYCVAKTHDGDFLTATMDMDEIKKIQASSKGATSKYSPWVNYFQEMSKKAVIKRASKTWSRTNVSAPDTLREAISVVNNHEGSDFQPTASKEQTDYYAQLIKGNNDLGLYVFVQGLEIEQQISIESDYVSANAEPRGKMKLKAEIKDRKNNGREMAEQYACAIIEATEQTAIDELEAELSADELNFINQRIEATK